MPVIAGKYLYVHMPKTGGVWMNNYLVKEHDGLLLPGHGHMAAPDVPHHHRKGRTILGTIRDPWSWYASWWTHAMCNNSELDAIAKFGQGSHEFRHVLQGALNPDPKRVPDQIGVIWNIPKPEAEKKNFTDRGIGLYSWAFHYIYEGADLVIDMTQMAEGLKELMGAHVDSQRYPPLNTSTHKVGRFRNRVRYKNLYTKELMRLVLEADCDLIQRLGYTEPFESATQALIQL